MMVINTLVEYSFWTPVLLWVGLHFWFRNVSYVVFLKKQLDRGEICDYLFTAITSVAASATVVWTLQKIGLGTNAYYGFVSVLIFVWIAYLMKRRTELKLTDLFQSAFYLEYRWVNYGIQRKGITMSDENVRDRAGLSYAHKLRNAEDHGRFWKYVKSMAASKKVPPEMFEVY